MSEFGNSLAISSSGLKAQAQRLRHVSENIANADTPGYRRKSVSFNPAMGAGREKGLVEVGRVQLDKSELREIYDPDHPLSNDRGTYLGSNVELMIEITDAREAQRSYEANLKMFDQARQMSAGLLDLLRK